METNVNKVQALELDEKDLVNAFEVEELEKRYEMGWFGTTWKGGVQGADRGWNLQTGEDVPLENYGPLTYPQHQVTPEGVDITADLEIH